MMMMITIIIVIIIIIRRRRRNSSIEDVTMEGYNNIGCSRGALGPFATSIILPIQLTKANK